MPVEVEEGRSYFWCSYGNSVKRQYWDGIQEDTGMTPVQFIAPARKKRFSAGSKNRQSHRFVMATIPS
jgi:hypothetical protein